MPRKISVKRASFKFHKQVEAIEQFVHIVDNCGLSSEHRAWCYDHAIIRMYRNFEELMLTTITAAININPATISHASGIRFPKHLSQGVCRYLVVGRGFFDFRGRDGLIKKLRTYIPEAHPLVRIVGSRGFKQSLERLSALRNFAAHDSIQAKRSALTASGQRRLKSAGHWLLKNKRFSKLTQDMKLIAIALNASAPY